MASHTLLSLGLAVATLIAAALLWLAYGAEAPPLPQATSFAIRAPTPGPSRSAADLMGISAQRNLQQAISASNQKVAGALNNPDH